MNELNEVNEKEQDGWKSDCATPKAKRRRHWKVVVENASTDGIGKQKVSDHATALG